MTLAAGWLVPQPVVLCMYYAAGEAAGMEFLITTNQTGQHLTFDNESLIPVEHTPLGHAVGGRKRSFDMAQMSPAGPVAAKGVLAGCFANLPFWWTRPTGYPDCPIRQGFSIPIQS